MIGCKLSKDLQSVARQAALCEGVEFETHLVEGGEAYAIVHFLIDYKGDLLVIGLHHHHSHISHLWSTVYALAQDAPCSVLGVHWIRAEKIDVSRSRVDAMGE